ncbi:hypothetical protein GCM10022423_00710 [Flavobacterium ginsengiterrae]|uniref:Transposase IS116/IS110/IS902 family protein n=1 Tax=Flavobacterium ginsengiterrae TaxID=871695 RepID=A0ABP7G9E9_9FLAO
MQAGIFTSQNVKNRFGYSKEDNCSFFLINLGIKMYRDNKQSRIWHIIQTGALYNCKTYNQYIKSKGKWNLKTTS